MYATAAAGSGPARRAGAPPVRWPFRKPWHDLLGGGGGGASDGVDVKRRGSVGRIGQGGPICRHGNSRRPGRPEPCRDFEPLQLP